MAREAAKIRFLMSVLVIIKTYEKKISKTLYRSALMVGKLMWMKHSEHWVRAGQLLPCAPLRPSPWRLRPCRGVRSSCQFHRRSREFRIMAKAVSNDVRMRTNLYILPFHPSLAYLGYLGMVISVSPYDRLNSAPPMQATPVALSAGTYLRFGHPCRIVSPYDGFVLVLQLVIPVSITFLEVGHRRFNRLLSTIGHSRDPDRLMFPEFPWKFLRGTISGIPVNII